jgi:hypothetical protein
VVPHPSRPPEPVRVRTITIEHRGELPLSEVLTKQEWAAYIRTMYKRKHRKINPVNIPLPNGVNPGGGANFDTSDSSSQKRKIGKIVPKGSRLTSERLKKMKIGGGTLSTAEWQLFVDILFEFEGAIAFEGSEMGLLNPDIEPPVVIHTVPHVPWQQQNIRLPRAMQEEATQQVKEKLKNGELEFPQGPYRSRYFLGSSMMSSF